MSRLYSKCVSDADGGRHVRRLVMEVEMKRRKERDDSQAAIGDEPCKLNRAALCVEAWPRFRCVWCVMGVRISVNSSSDGPSLLKCSAVACTPAVPQRRANALNLVIIIPQGTGAASNRPHCEARQSKERVRANSPAAHSLGTGSAKIQAQRHERN